MSASSVPGPLVTGRTGASDALRKPAGVLTFLSWHVGASASPDLLRKLHEYVTDFEVDVLALHVTSGEAPNLEGFDLTPPDGPSAPSTAPPDGPSVPSAGVLLFKRQGIKDISLYVFETVSALRQWWSEQQQPLPDESCATQNSPRLNIIRLRQPSPTGDLAHEREEKFVYTPQREVCCELWPPRAFRTIGREPAVLYPLGDSVLFCAQPALMLDVYCESWDAPPPGFLERGKLPQRAKVKVPTFLARPARPHTRSVKQRYSAEPTSVVAPAGSSV